MENVFQITVQNRKALHNILVRTPRKDLLKIPNGFNNNIWWNIAHVVVTQQLLVYGLSGLPKHIDGEIVQKFRKGTVPDGTATNEEIAIIKGFLVPTIEKTELDYKHGRFQRYTTYTTSTKATLLKVEDALTFNLYHEGLHLGAILALQKALIGNGAS
ncbi:MAG: DinB family protein [Bacteroidota bacterium]